MMQLHLGDSLEVLKTLPAQSVNCCVTSPPYWGLRNYQTEGQLGLEKTPEEFVANLVDVFREVRRVLKDDGTLWLNLGESFRNGFAQSIPWRVAIALQADGWRLVQDIIWHKTRVMPMGLKRRFLPNHEYIFLFTKKDAYFFDQDAAKEQASPESLKRYERGFRDVRSGTTKHLRVSGEICPRQGPRRRISAPDRRIRRTVWTVCPAQFKGAHFATFPQDLIEPCVLAGCPEGGVVLDPFFGAGTTGLVAQKHGRDWVGIELNPEYATIARKRLGVKEEACA